MNVARLEIDQLFTQGTRRGHPCTLETFLVQGNFGKNEKGAIVYPCNSFPLLPFFMGGQMSGRAFVHTGSLREKGKANINTLIVSFFHVILVTYCHQVIYFSSPEPKAHW